MNVNFKIVISILGLLIMMNGAFMLLCLPVSLYYNDGHWYAILISGLVTLVIGFMARMMFKET